MGLTSLTMNTPPDGATVPAGTGQAESIDKTRLLGTECQRAVEVNSGVCQHCHCVIGDAHALNVSPLARIDVFDLPDESDVLRTDDRFH